MSEAKRRLAFPAPAAVLPGGRALHSFLGIPVPTMAATPKLLLVGDFPDIGKGQLPADGVIPAGGYAGFAARLVSHALRGYRIHVHTSGANPKSWALATLCAAAGRLARVPAMITFHSGLGPGWLAADPVRARIACAIGNAFGTIIAVSEEIRDALMSCGVSRERIEVLPAFSRSYLEPGAPPAGLRDLRAQAAPLYCAMLAPGPVYGAQVLLRAFAEVHARNPRARLALYGPGTLELDLARSAGEAAGAVRPFGELHRAVALALIGGSDVFVRPTLADGDSVSLREAVVLGRVVVATAVGTRPAEARLVPPGDSRALADALSEAAEARPVLRLARESDPGADCIDRLLALYGFDSGEEPAPAPRPHRSRPSVEGSACAASAAS
ncbi:MAG: glycosyltransferase family 4 protein [Deltaproteobacteria bacterium]|nr:MAG: glycosyltransferase family 4 protein [Deltaproteobacteria bacterium]